MITDFLINIYTMKNIIFILLTFVTTLTFGQEKIRVTVSHFNKRTGVATINGEKFKLIQEVKGSGLKMNEAQYNRYIHEGEENREFIQKKILRVKPDPSVDFYRFSTENYLLEYWSLKKKYSTVIIILKQSIPLSTKLKK